MEVALKLSDVQPPVELQPDYMQVRTVGVLCCNDESADAVADCR